MASRATGSYYLRSNDGKEKETFVDVTSSSRSSSEEDRETVLDILSPPRQPPRESYFCVSLPQSSAGTSAMGVGSTLLLSLLDRDPQLLALDHPKCPTTLPLPITTPTTQQSTTKSSVPPHLNNATHSSLHHPKQFSAPPIPTTHTIHTCPTTHPTSTPTCTAHSPLPRIPPSKA